MIGRSSQLRLAIVILVIVAAGMALWSARDWRAHVVVTSSMAPAIPAGSLAIVAPAASDSVRPGDVLAFQHPADPQGPLVAHRVTVVVRTEDAVGFATRGDANQRSDSWLVGADDIEGRVRAHVPLAGALVSQLRASAVLLLAAALVLVAALLSDARAIGEWLRRAQTTRHDELHQRLRALASDSPTSWRSL